VSSIMDAAKLLIAQDIPELPLPICHLKHDDSCGCDREYGAYNTQNGLSNGNTYANEQNSDKHPNEGELQDFVHGTSNKTMTRLRAQIFSEPGDLLLCGEQLA
jgi:hypothetical protein